MEKLITIKNFIRIFVLLLIAAMLMFVSNYLLMKSSTQRLYEQMKENNRLIVSGIIQSFDDSFKDINNLIYSIDTLPNYSKDIQTDINYHNYLLHKEMSKLINLSSSHDYIEEVAVFLDHSNTAVTSKGTINLHEFLNNQYKNNQTNSMYWASFFKEERQLEVFPAMKFMKKISNNKFQTKNLLTIAVHTRISSKNIIVFLDVDALLDSVNHNTLMNETSFMILDHDNNVILSTEDGMHLGDLVQDLYVNEGEEAALKNQEYEFAVYKSDYNGFTYINRIPIQYTAIESITDDEKSILFISVILTLFLLLILGFILFHPMKNISDVIGGEPNWKSIQTRINELKHNIKASKTKEKLLESELSRYIFINAIHQSRYKNEIHFQTKDYFSDFFPNRQFLLVKLSFFCSKTIDETTQTLPIEDCKEFILNKLKESLKFITVFHEKDMDFLVLIGMSQISERETVIESVQHLIDHVPDAWESDVDATISKVYDSKVDHLRLAYRDIIQTSIYRNIDVNESIFDAEAIDFTIEVYFPADKVEKLSNLLVSGNENDSIEIINEIINNNIEMNIQLHQFIAILQSLLLSMKRHVKLNKEEQQELHKLEMDFDRSLRESFNLEEMRSSLLKIMTFISQKSKETGDNKLNPNFITQYIELHYMDNLYLEHMAAITDTSSKYFSKYFKNALGVNFIEYLHRVRINHAKEYLRNENSTIAEIGEKVGYLNATTFASTFKKYTGMSPTNYREKIINSE